MQPLCSDHSDILPMPPSRFTSGTYPGPPNTARVIRAPHGAAGVTGPLTVARRHLLLQVGFKGLQPVTLCAKARPAATRTHARNSAHTTPATLRNPNYCHQVDTI